MFSYLFMKLLESNPRSYDRRMRALSGGRVVDIKRDVAAQVPPGARVLEIGCGTGELGQMLVERGATVEGFDLSPAMIEVALERIEANGSGDRFSVRQMGAEEMDGLEASRYDVVVATLVLSELSDDERLFALRHAARALVSGGRLIVAAEVVPRTGWRRVIQGMVRAPSMAAAFLVSATTTRPVVDLVGDVRRAGLVVEREVRSHGGAVALVVARES